MQQTGNGQRTGQGQTIANREDNNYLAEETKNDSENRQNLDHGDNSERQKKDNFREGSFSSLSLKKLSFLDKIYPF